MRHFSCHAIQGYDIKQEGKNGYWEAVSILCQDIVRMSN